MQCGRSGELSQQIVITTDRHGKGFDLLTMGDGGLFGLARSAECGIECRQCRNAQVQNDRPDLLRLLPLSGARSRPGGEIPHDLAGSTAVVVRRTKCA